jgi:Coenzyme PQQ synthesis protein D (PqqD)
LTLITSDPYAHLARVATLTVSMAAARLKPVPQVLARRMPGGTVLVNLASNRIFELNETGARVWELMSAGLDRDQLIEQLVQEFAVDAARASVELDTLLARLEREGLLSTS